MTMSAPDEPSDVAIRLAAVEAAARRLGADPNPHKDHRDAQYAAAGDVVAAAEQIAEYIREGRVSW
jgi:hypothetical protein